MHSFRYEIDDSNPLWRVFSCPRAAGNAPTLTQLPSNSPQALIDIIRCDAALFSGATGVPLNSMGIIQDNPSSADIEVKNMHAGTLDRIVGGRGDAMWARVPVGESCEWCIMTGSLGYYYYSAQAAAKASHAKCNCLIVPKVGNKTPEIDGYDHDALYMQWVKSVKEEGMRPEHELTKARKHKNSLHRDGWETVNPVEVICDMLPMARRDRKREEGSKKIIWGSDYASYLVLIEPSEGYFRIIDTENKDGKQPFVYYDGRTFDKDTDNDLYLKNTHYKILGFENA